MPCVLLGRASVRHGSIVKRDMRAYLLGHPMVWTKWERSSKVHEARLCVGDPLGMLASSACTGQEGAPGPPGPKEFRAKTVGAPGPGGAEAPLNWATPSHFRKRRATPCGHREQTLSFQLNQSTGSPGRCPTPSKGPQPVSRAHPRPTGP